MLLATLIVPYRRCAAERDEMPHKAAAFLTPQLLIPIVVCGFAAMLRASLNADRPIWFDEAFSWTLATEFGSAEIVERTGRDVHPPLYYLLLRCWISVFGDSLIAMRSLSVTVGTAAVGVAWLVGRGMAGMESPEGGGDAALPRSDLARRKLVGGLILSALVASSAFQIRWSGEVRMYALLSLLFLLATLSAIRATSGDGYRKRWWIAFSLSCTALMYTHNYGTFSVVGLSAFVVLTVFFRWRHDRQDESWRAMGLCLAAIAGTAVLYLPWLPVLLAQKAQVADDYWMQRFSWHSLAAAWDHLFIPENAYAAIQGTRGAVILSLVVVLTLVLQVGGRWADRLCFWLTMTPIVLAVIISNVGSSIIGDRLFVLAHLSVLMMITRAMIRWLDATTAVLLTALLMIDGVYVHRRYQHQLNVADHQGIQAAMQIVNDSSDDSIPTIVLQPCVYFSARYYATHRNLVMLYTLPENIRHYTGSPILRDGEFHSISELAERIEPVVWIITSSGYTAGYSEPFLPTDWVRDYTKTFPAVYAFEGEVRLSKYRRSSSRDDMRLPTQDGRK